MFHCLFPRELYITGGRGGGRGDRALKLSLASGKWYSLARLETPRRQHACTKVTYYCGLRESCPTLITDDEGEYSFLISCACLAIVSLAPALSSESFFLKQDS